MAQMVEGQFDSTKARVPSLPLPGPAPLKVFCSYCHIDEILRQRFHVHLAPLRRAKRITPWYDHNVQPGSNISKEIDSALKSSDIYIPLISADFINSDYCMDVELELALELEQLGQIRIVPVILSPCGWQHTKIQPLKALPTDGKPIETAPCQSAALNDVAEQLWNLVDVILKERASRPRKSPLNDATYAASLYANLA